MSGSGGGGGGGGGGGPSFQSCAALRIQTPLNSPNAAVLKTLAVGDILQVDFVPPHGPVVVKKGAQTAGSITAGQLQNLIKCLTDGWVFIAEVKKLKGGVCEVEIRAK